MARTTTGQAKVLSDAQQRAVLAVLNSERERAMFLLSTKAALRAVEIAGLDWRHVRGEHLELTTDICKGGRPRTVPINKDLAAALEALKAVSDRTGDHDPVFWSLQYKGHRLSPNAVAQWFRYLFRDRMGWEGFSSHSGRRTAITAMARKASLVGGSIRDVQAIAGHANMNTTQIYIESHADARRKMMDLI